MTRTSVGGIALGIVVMFAAVASAQQPAPNKTYALVLADSRGKLGPALRLTKVSCAEREKAAAESNDALSHPCGDMPIERGVIEGRGLTLDQLAAVLTRVTGATVVNKTGLSGLFSWDLYYAAEHRNSPFKPTPPELAAAIERQLGLRLVPEP